MDRLHTPTISVVAGSVAVLAAAALAACSSSVSASSNRPSDPPVVQPTSPLAECPPRFLPPPNTGHGQLVAATPNSAVLCTYTSNGDSPSLTKAQALEGGIADLIGYLNALPTTDDGASATTCLLADSPQFTIVFGYASGATTEVSIDGSCGQVGGSGGVRRLTSLSKVLAYWR